MRTLIPEPTGANAPVVCRNIYSFRLGFSYTTIRYSCFPFVACIDIPGGALHLFAPLCQPIPREKQCAAWANGPC